MRSCARGGYDNARLDRYLEGVGFDGDVARLARVWQDHLNPLPADHDRPAGRYPPRDLQGFGQPRWFSGSAADSAQPGAGLLGDGTGDNADHGAVLTGSPADLAGVSRPSSAGTRRPRTLPAARATGLREGHAWRLRPVSVVSCPPRIYRRLGFLDAGKRHMHLEAHRPNGGPEDNGGGRSHSST
jgi:hypothetical protein